MAKAGFGPVFRHQGDRVFVAGARARGLGLALLVKSALLGAMAIRLPSSTNIISFLDDGYFIGVILRIRCLLPLS